MIIDIPDKHQIHYQTFVERNPDAVLLIDFAGQIYHANPAAEDLFGYDSQALMQMNIRDMFTSFDNDVINEHEPLLSSGVPQMFETRVIESEHTERTVQFKAIPHIVNDQSEAIYLVARDITRYRQTEERLQRLTEELQRSNRDLEDFAYIASHDLQEPLRKIQTFSSLLELDTESHLSEPGRSYLERMVRAAGRMRGLIEDLLAYSRAATSTHDPELVDLARLMPQILEELGNQIERADAVVEIAELPVVYAHPVQMQHLFQNLISNGLKFHRTEVQPRVTVNSDGQPSRLPDGRLARSIRVTDNGIGFDERYKERILQPFQRLHGHAEYAGTGIGLAICRKIVEGVGGELTVASQPGSGSTFCVTLPIKVEASNM